MEPKFENELRILLLNTISCGSIRARNGITMFLYGETQVAVDPRDPRLDRTGGIYGGEGVQVASRARERIYETKVGATLVAPKFLVNLFGCWGSSVRN